MPGTAFAVVEKNFEANTTGDLVALCGTPVTDTYYTAAINFCHGFALGTVDYHEAAAQAEKRQPLYCLPTPRPSRNEAVAAFVAWAKERPAVLATAPSEGVIEFLAFRYPCGK
jgi:hypothetical protein